MYYSEDVIEEVRARSDIVDVVSQAVHLEKKGANYFGLCPFHNEKTPSFSVTPTKQMFYCFGCGAGGNVFSFVQKYDNLSFREALEQLADRAGYALPKTVPTADRRNAREKRERLLEINKEAATWFFYRMRDEAGRTGLSYFEKRGLSPETMKRFGLGYAPVTRDALCAYLREKGFSDADIAEAGVAVRDEKYGLRDKFWNRVIFPIQDVNRRVIGFGGRVLGSGEPKYLNSPETPVFDKSRNLYGLCYAKHARKGYLILCEGYMDVIAMHQAGFTEAVASLGTSFTAGQATVLKRYTGEVLLAYDFDPAGTKAVLRNAQILRQAGLRAKVIRLSPYKDPDELIVAEGAEALDKRIREAENPFVFEIGVLQENCRMDDPDEVTEFHRQVAEKLAADFTDAAERENYLQATCARYHIEPQIMRDMVARFALHGAGKRPETVPDDSFVNRSADRRARSDEKSKAQRRLLTLLAEDKRVYPAIRSCVVPSDFTDPFCREIADETFSALETGDFDASRLVDRYEDEETRELVTRVFHEAGSGEEDAPSREQELHEVITGILRLSYEEQVKQADPADASSYLKAVREGKQRLEAFTHKRIHL